MLPLVALLKVAPAGAPEAPAVPEAPPVPVAPVGPVLPDGPVAPIPLAP